MHDLKKEIRRCSISIWILIAVLYGILELINPQAIPTSVARLGTASMAIVTFFLNVCAFFGLYVAAINIYQCHLNGTLPAWGYILGGPIVAAMLAIDVFFQVTVFTFIYYELPREWTVTERLSRWKATAGEDRRKHWSVQLCKLLNVFTPAGQPHC